MQVLTNIRSRFLLKRSPKERLIAESSTLGNRLLPQHTAERKLKKAGEYADGFLGSKRWEAWRWLTRTHRTASLQLKLLAVSREKIKQAKELDLGDEQLSTFIECFSILVDEGSGLENLNQEIDSSAKSWSNVAATVRKARPPVSLTHAFLNLSDSSGVEVASLFIAGLIALGAMYMAFYYDAAVGQSATAYWTINDLIIQGILIIPLVLIVLFVIEIIFFLFTRGSSYGAHGKVLKYPLLFVLPVFIIMAIIAVTYGYIRGGKEFIQFTETIRDEFEMATVLDDTVLNDVYLVGTTDRTAIFLQVRDWNTFPPKDERPSFRESISCVWSAFLPVLECARDANPTGYQVLVMDRALVVCHAKKGQCPRAEENVDGGVDDQILGEEPSQIDMLGTSLENTIADVNDHMDTEFDSIRSQIDDEFAAMDTHIDRHYSRIMDAIRLEDLTTNTMSTGSGEANSVREE